MAKIIFKPVCSNCGYLLTMPVTVYQNLYDTIIPRYCPCCNEPFDSAELVAERSDDQTAITFNTVTV